MRLVAYVRTSTNGGANGDSSEAQEEASRTWAALRGHEVVVVRRDDGLSGELNADDRPGLSAALVDLEERRAEGLVVHRIDRLARELHAQEATLARAWQADASVFEAVYGEVPRDDPDDPMRRFARRMMAEVNDLERRMIAVRLRRGRIRKRQRGGYSGGATVPLGYRVEGKGKNAHLVADADGQRVTTRVVELRCEGLTLAAVANRLNAEAVPTARGGRWHVSTVRRVLGREATS